MGAQSDDQKATDDCVEFISRLLLSLGRAEMLGWNLDASMALGMTDTCLGC